MVSLKLKIPKLNYKYPSVSEMEEFGRKFKKDWDILTKDKEFKELLLEDLELANIRAQEMLGIK